MRWPMGFSSAQIRLAVVSLMTATGMPPRTSRSSNPRPRFSGMPIAWKYPGLTTCAMALLGASRVFPSISKSWGRLPPVSGKLSIKPTACAPGSVCSLGNSSFTKASRRRRSAGSTCSGRSGAGIRNVRTFCAFIPGATRCNSRKLRTSRPAPTRSTKVNATCETTSKPPNRRPRTPEVEARALSFNES